jgi:23S rRNA pseudouridine1911/1915/1917 synthase
MVNNGYTYTDRVAAADAGRTALEFYALRHPHFTRAQWLERLSEGRIARRGLALLPDDLLNTGDLLEYHRPPWKEPEVRAAIPLLHQDEQVMIFDKPDGMPVLPGGEYLEHSMVMLLRKTVEVGLSPLHRLGRGTTGAILFTRNRNAAVQFSRLMRERKIRKTYLALVRGTGMQDSFAVDAPIGRVPHPRLGEIHDVSLLGKTSLSICTVLARHRETATSLVQVEIPTGRTHQIRIHLASIGHPLVGDRFYLGLGQPGDSERTGDSVLPGDAGYILHSWKLQYSDPVTGEQNDVEAPVRGEILSWCEEADYRICVDHPLQAATSKRDE